jgi:3-hydroxyisobutyrate dehydrogenase and related beta-hydroxyacid dehydrogenases
MTGSDLTSPAPLAFVGLGALGLPMAINLHRAGYRLRLHTRSREGERHPDLAGALPCASPAAAATDCRALVLCVSDDTAVEAVLWGTGGAGSTLPAGSLVIDCSTIRPDMAQAMAQRLAERDVRYLDAPVTGGTEGARARQLHRALWRRRARPGAGTGRVLEVLGSANHHFGAVGRRPAR